MGVVGMHTHSGVELGVLGAQLDRLPAGIQVYPWNQDAAQAALPGTFQDLRQVFLE